MKKTFLIISICMFIATFAFAGVKKVSIPEEFKKIKALEGKWEGSTVEKGKTIKVRATYEVTSAGTAVLEKLFNETADEMVTVYYTNGNNVKMTHYCTLGNQPQMRLKKKKAKT